MKLILQFKNKPELGFEEMVDLVDRFFPLGVEESSFSLEPKQETYTLGLVLPRQDALTEEQHDWLRHVAFAARYIKSYRVETEVEQGEPS